MALSSLGHLQLLGLHCPGRQVLGTLKVWGLLYLAKTAQVQIGITVHQRQAGGRCMWHILPIFIISHFLLNPFQLFFLLDLKRIFFFFFTS